MLRLSLLLVVVSIVCALSAVSSFSVTSRSFRTSSMYSNRPDINDFDSSELNYGSSTDFKNAQVKKMLLEEEAQSNRISDLLKTAQKKADYLAAEKKVLIIKDQEATTPAPTIIKSDSKIVVEDNKKVSTTLSSAGSGFDIGLLIAFPVIVGTLGLFFVFPLLIESLNKSLPPPMSY